MYVLVLSLVQYYPRNSNYEFLEPYSILVYDERFIAAGVREGWAVGQQNIIDVLLITLSIT